MSIAMKKIAAEVRANFARIDACPGPHDFAVSVTWTSGHPKRYRCSKCLGEVESLHAHWYGLGLAHAATPRTPEGTDP